MPADFSTFCLRPCLRAQLAAAAIIIFKAAAAAAQVDAKVSKLFFFRPNKIPLAARLAYAVVEMKEFIKPSLNSKASSWKLELLINGSIIHVNSEWRTHFSQTELKRICCPVFALRLF